MGVQGLWQLLQSTGRPVSLDSLEGKILAVDVSLWLHRTVKGMRDKDGNPLPNAHLHGLFNRICKLLYYRIKPVFVFDGGVPQLKKQTLAARREKKEFSEKQSGKASKQLLTTLLKSQAVRQALGQEGTLNPDAIVAQSSQPRERDMFELPPMTESLPGSSKESEVQPDCWEERLTQRKLIEMEYQDLDEVDIKSDDFRSLPSEIQHEILTVLKERRKMNSWSTISDLPQESTEFSKYQMSKLLKQSQLTTHIDQVRKDMNNQNSDSFFTEQFGKDFFNENVQSRKLASEDTSHFILIKGLSHKSKQENIGQLVRQGRLIESPETSDKTETTSDELVLDSEPESTHFNKRDSGVQGTVIHISDSDSKMEVNDKTVNLVRESRTSGSDAKSNENFVSDIFVNESKIYEDRPSENNERLQLGNLDQHNMQVSVYEIDNNVSGKLVTKDSQLHLPLKSSMVSNSRTDAVVVEQPEIFKDIFVKRKIISCDDDTYSKKQKSLDLIKPAATAIHGNDKQVAAENEKNMDASSADRAIGQLVTEDCENMASSSDNSDDDFIEVTIDPNKTPEDLDLFPASMFEEHRNDQNFMSSTNSTRSLLKTDSDVQVSVIGDNFASASDDITKEYVGSSLIMNEKEVDDRADLKSKSVEGKQVENVENVDNELKESSQSDQAPPVDLVSALQGLTEVELLDLQDDLEVESRSLQRERGKQARLATSITDQMYNEAQDLLQLFGIPFVVSTMEAEAQCAELDMTDHTHGTITDDSDIWLFGGKRVYKNFFNQDKAIELFTDVMVKGQLGLDREIMINIALLCGSDYTDGIQGIGPVTAVEILGEFPEPGIDGLVAFKSWYDDTTNRSKGHQETKIKSKLKELEVTAGFPNLSVVEAYLNPAVEKSSEAFSWHMPDLDLLREFASEKLGWNKSRSDAVLLPVMKQLNRKDSQPRIKSFLQPEMYLALAEVKSKRLSKAIHKLSHPTTSESTVKKTNEKRMQKAVEVWNKTKGKKSSKGRGKWKMAVEHDGDTNKMFVPNNEVVLSESSSNEEELEGGFIREDESKTFHSSSKNTEKHLSEMSDKNFVSLPRSSSRT